MAMQAGMGLSKVLIIVGAGYTGSILLRNGKLSDVLAELQNLVKGMETSGDKQGADSNYTDALASQVHRLAMEVRQLAGSRSITVLNGSSGGGNVTAFVLPAATVGALGYGYMWWKGLSFSDLMYVTKRNMANAVSSMTKHLEQVSVALAATKRHLTQRIENLDGKLDDQKELSTAIKNEVVDARDKITKIGNELRSIRNMVGGLDGKVDSMGYMQNITFDRVTYLCNFVPEKVLGRKPDFLQDVPKRGYLGYSEAETERKGLQYITEAMESGNSGENKTDTSSQIDSDSFNNNLKDTSRVGLIKG